jgi:deoxyribodipyrimidine photo-lyase
LIVWFRRDLRLADNPALTAAAQTGQPILPVFVLHAAERPPGGASRWWLHGSLTELEASLRRRGSRLVLRAGDAPVLLREIARQSGASGLFFNRGWEPEERRLEQRVCDALAADLTVESHHGDALHEPGSVLSAAGSPLRVFTPFWRACLRRPEPPTPVPAPAEFPSCDGAVTSDDLTDWRLRPAGPDWAGGLHQRWRPGERAALQSLDRFVDFRLAGYPRQRDRPDLPGTSQLSPHLHFGEIGPRQVWHAVRSRLAGDASLTASGEAFLRELGWREFSLHLLHLRPDLPVAALQQSFERFPWRRAPADLRRWQKGQTGYPLVDAGMRELWVSGWMHNRVRMIAASFLVKHLLVHWREGEAWFWDTLVDADLANNAASWQWVAGCGADAAPYFRIFNPVLQGRKFDPDGAYVKRWLPELARLPPRFIHAPWSAPPAVLEAAGVRLGRDYPTPIVEHDAARRRALRAYSILRTGLTGSTQRTRARSRSS